MEETEKQNPRLAKREVLERLDLCGSPEVVKQLYDFGLLLSKDLFDRIKALEVKATSFAAYGAAIVSFLVATSASWSSVGNLSSKADRLFRWSLRTHMQHPRCQGAVAYANRGRQPR